MRDENKKKAGLPDNKVMSLFYFGGVRVPKLRLEKFVHLGLKTYSKNQHPRNSTTLTPQRDIRVEIR